jgi:hypothetical protein
MDFLARASAATRMKDHQAQVEKPRRDAAECALIRDLATDKAKGERFDRLTNRQRPWQIKLKWR